MIIWYSVIHVPRANELCTFLIVATTYSSRIETSLNSLIPLKTNFENQIHCNLSIFSLISAHLNLYTVLLQGMNELHTFLIISPTFLSRVEMH